MILSAYQQAAPPDPGHPNVVQLWLGVFGTNAPPPPIFTINRQLAQPLEAPKWSPIRDKQVDAEGSSLNHRTIVRFPVPEAGRAYEIDIDVGGVQRSVLTRTLPKEVPALLSEGFKILLCSCYFQPEDAGGLFGSIISQIKVQPDLIIMAGDQVYLDLPLFEDLPEDEPALSRVLGEKYRRNWASSALGVSGLEQVLARAPVVCIPDDHEFWNNYPFPQKQLPNTWRDAVRQRWADAARALYADYQASTPPGTADRGFIRIDVMPLSMLFVDMRSERHSDFQQLMSPEAHTALITWVDDLIASREEKRTTVGVLCSGQALFIESPGNERDKRNVDAEMANYNEFGFVQEAVARLADAGIPLVYLTGDVHWSRLADGRDLRTNRTLLYEVISSPSRLIRIPFVDSAKVSLDSLKGIFGEQGIWPRHSDALDTPDRFGIDRRFQLRSLLKRRGDQVAIVSFAKSGEGIDLTVSYYAIHADKAVAKSQTIGPYKLRNN